MRRSWSEMLVGAVIVMIVTGFVVTACGQPHPVQGDATQDVRAVHRQAVTIYEDGRTPGTFRVSRVLDHEAGVTCYVMMGTNGRGGISCLAGVPSP